MIKKILIAYATRYGSTTKIAETIQNKLSELGYETKTANILDIDSIESYDAIIVGSPLNMGKWLPEAKEFMQFRKNELNKVPVIAFTTGITLKNPTEHNILKAKFATDEILPYVQPKETGFFAGNLNSNELNENDKQIIILAKPETGDFRDFSKVENWTKTIAEKYFNH
ncbi:hypothetical protein F1737_02850 [Methanoplanus sp. FWC-SCC4]|uniref:Flavodoxin-like domain-containing protein n=1 Tax=Methanochimaera problematica TaxID=2609417 RepID=A0AA97FAA3_9EURY|nr:flavodoxin domain-containing protein [Methanoplanus sp. FWC-SCC4]WOF15700.1 hypothetical protein F1737_02850 [Methanoplanus sp. FWC-SCC4]